MEWAAAQRARQGNGLAAAQGQRGGRRYAGIDGGRPPAGNSAQGSISAAFFALGKGMDWRRSTLLLPAAVLCPGQGNRQGSGGLSCCPLRPANSALGSISAAVLCPGQGMDWRPVNPAAALAGRPIGNTAQGKARERIGSSARAARRPPICRNRRPAAVTLLPWARQGGGGQSW